MLSETCIELRFTKCIQTIQLVINKHSIYKYGFVSFFPFPVVKNQYTKIVLIINVTR